MKTDILIIGAGISGLHTAYQLQKVNRDFIVVEARDRIGGRIQSQQYQEVNRKKNEASLTSAAFDIGPSWFWPGQFRINNLIDELGLQESRFNQNAEGLCLFEDQQENIQQGLFGITMQGAYRLNGGMQELTDNLAKDIDSKKLVKSARVTSIERKENHLLVTIKNKNSINPISEIQCNKVVMALPPRLALATINFLPELEKSRFDELNSYATWMAGHAKVIVSYSSPFWLEQGFSGDAVSHIGPMREIHDASSKPDSKDQAYALFGFVGIPGSYRKEKTDEIKKAAISQLVRLFGTQAETPIRVVMKDWAQDEFTATDIDQSMNGGHASSSIRNYSEASFENQIIWSGTETADHLQGYNGLIEGALEASERSLNIIDDQ